MKRLFILVSLVLFASGCVSQRTAEFIESEYEPYSKSGKAEICGHALLRTPSGDPRIGAGATVYLKPVTTYSTEWFNTVVKGHQQLSPPDPRSLKFQKTVRADSKGKFCFFNLPAGYYYLACLISWEGSSAISGEEGGYAYATVTVGKSEKKRNVVLIR